MKCTSSVRTGERRRKKIRRCWRTTTAELCWAGVMGAGGTVLPVDCDQVGEGEDSSQHALYWSSSSPRPNGYAGIAAAGGMPKRGTALDMNSSSGGVCPIGTARDETLVPVRAGCGGSRAFSSQRWLGAVLQNCVVKRQGCAGSLIVLCLIFHVRRPSRGVRVCYTGIRFWPMPVANIYHGHCFAQLGSCCGEQQCHYDTVSCRQRQHAHAKARRVPIFRSQEPRVPA